MLWGGGGGGGGGGKFHLLLLNIIRVYRVMYFIICTHVLDMQMF